MKDTPKAKKNRLAGGGEWDPGGAEEILLCRGTPLVGAHYRAVTEDRPYERQDPPIRGRIAIRPYIG